MKPLPNNVPGQLAVATALLSLHGLAGSATATTTLLVTATVVAACNVSTTPVAKPENTRSHRATASPIR